MVEQLARPRDRPEIYWFSEQPYGAVNDQDLEKYESGRLRFPNSYFDPEIAHVLYNQYHEQYALADEVGFDGIMTNEHHAAYWCMKPSANLDAAVIAKVTKKVKIAILGNVIAVADPVRIAEQVAMLDCYSGGRIISGFVRGSAAETLLGGTSPTENRARFEEAHDLIIKCWTEPGPFRFEGEYYQYRVVNPWVMPMQKPRPDIWFPGSGSPESAIRAAQHGHPYMNLGALTDVTKWLKQIYIDTAQDEGYQAGPEHFGYLLRAFVADTDEKAIEVARDFLWTSGHRQRGPREHNDPPGYQSRVAAAVRAQRPSGRLATSAALSYDELREVNNIIVGNPDTVIRKLTDIIEGVGPGYLHIYGSDGPMPHKDVMRSIELFGKEVIPALHEVPLKPYEPTPRAGERPTGTGTAGLEP
jgi:alkanesulfonate monooxygenase SsuD/methylene tetrahydromethanopterin reductase-like flavin-dependent oxidoreductase (luciferase family)